MLILVAVQVINVPQKIELGGRAVDFGRVWKRSGRDGGMGLLTKGGTRRGICMCFDSYHEN